MMYLPVNQLHLRVRSLVDKFKQGRGTRYIDKAIVLDREALELCPPGHLMRAAWLTSDVSNRYDQER